MARWYVQIELRDFEESLAKVLEDLMDPVGDVVVDVFSSGGGRYVIDLHLESASGLKALEDAFDALELERNETRVERAHSRSAEVVDHDVAEMELLGVRELATELGVTPQRVSAIWREIGNFPPPFALLAAGPVWRRSEIDRFVKEWPRKAGRPKAPVPVGLEGMVLMSCGHWRPEVSPVDDSGFCPTCGRGVPITDPAAVVDL